MNFGRNHGAIGVDQRVVNDARRLAGFDPHDRNFDDPIDPRRKARGFEVDDGDRGVHDALGQNASRHGGVLGVRYIHDFDQASSVGLSRVTRRAIYFEQSGECWYAALASGTSDALPIVLEQRPFPTITGVATELRRRISSA